MPYSIAADGAVFAVSLAGWTALFLACKAVARRRLRAQPTQAKDGAHVYAIMAVSSLHATLSAAHGAFMASQLWTVVPVAEHTQFRAHIMAEAAYYAYDTVAEVVGMSRAGGRLDWLSAGFLLHHAPPVLGFAFYLPWSYGQDPALLAVTAVVTSLAWIAHATTPLQNFRWFLDKTSLADRWPGLYRANLAIFLATFALVRLYGIVPLLRAVVWLKALPAGTTAADVYWRHIPLRCRLGSAVLYALNVAWFAMNVRRAARVLRRRGPLAAAPSVAPPLEKKTA